MPSPARGSGAGGHGIRLSAVIHNVGGGLPLSRWCRARAAEGQQVRSAASRLHLQARRSYSVLLPVAVVLALACRATRYLLVALAYTYLASAFVELAGSRCGSVRPPCNRNNPRCDNADQDAPDSISKTRTEGKSVRASGRRYAPAQPAGSAPARPVVALALDLTAPSGPLNSWLRLAIGRPVPVPLAFARSTELERARSERRRVHPNARIRKADVHAVGVASGGDSQDAAPGHGVQRVFDDVGQRSRDERPVDTNARHPAGTSISTRCGRQRRSGRIEDLLQQCGQSTARDGPWVMRRSWRTRNDLSPQLDLRQDVADDNPGARD